MSLASLTGCGSFYSAGMNQAPIIFGGVRTDALWVYGQPAIAPLLLIDCPLSLTVDVLCLPFSIPWTIQNGEPRLARPVPEENPHQFVEGILKGIVIQDEVPGYQVFPMGEWPPAKVRPLAGAFVKVLSDPNAGELTVNGRPVTDTQGGYLLEGHWNASWRFIRVELEGYEPVEIPVAKLHSPTDQEYWGDHRLLIRMKRR